MSGDLSITAQYTSATWAWAGFPDAELLVTRDARRVFDVTNAALAIARVVARDQPSLRHSLVQRHAMIDHLLAERGAHHVIELAAGLSRRGATASRDPEVSYVEVDLPDVIERKRALLGRTPAGQAVLARANLVLVASDVATIALAALAPVRAPVFVIAEGLVMYLAGDARRALFGKVAALAAAIDDTVDFVFDLVPSDELPPPGRIGTALERTMKRFTGGRSFERDAHSRDQIASELRAAGFATVSAHDPASVAAAWQLPHAREHTQMVVFHARASQLRANSAVRS